METEIKKEESKQAEQTNSANPKESDELINAKAEIIKLKSQRDETILKESGFKPEYSKWIKTIAQSEDMSFDKDNIKDYLKDKKFNIFKDVKINESQNLSPKQDNQSEQKSTEKHKLTEDEINNIKIEIPG